MVHLTPCPVGPQVPVVEKPVFVGTLNQLERRERDQELRALD